MPSERLSLNSQSPPEKMDSQPQKKMGEKPVAVYGAIVANFIIAILKFIFAIVSGSSAMLSEAIHSTADTGNEFLLLWGIRQSKKPADESHPFGYGQERYFWGLIVAVVLFGMGGGISIYEGITKLGKTYENGNPLWNYVVLGTAFVVEGVSWLIGVRELRKKKRPDENLWQAVGSSKNPEIFIVIGEDTADLIGLIIAFIGIFLQHALKSTYPDAIASIIIGIVLGLISFFLAYESKSLLIGEAAGQDMVNDIHSLILRNPAVESARMPLTMHFGPENIFLGLTIRFKNHLSSNELAKEIASLEAEIHQTFPSIGRIYVELGELDNRKKNADPDNVAEKHPTS
jgi:cation diffusion facilitator family transporter